jgi:hypothetical protein
MYEVFFLKTPFTLPLTTVKPFPSRPWRSNHKAPEQQRGLALVLKTLEQTFKERE